MSFSMFLSGSWPPAPRDTIGPNSLSISSLLIAIRLCILQITHNYAWAASQPKKGLLFYALFALSFICCIHNSESCLIQQIEKGKLHGCIDVGLSVMAIKKKAKCIDLDAEENIYHLKVNHKTNKDKGIPTGLNRLKA